MKWCCISNGIVSRRVRKKVLQRKKEVGNEMQIIDILLSIYYYQTRCAETALVWIYTRKRKVKKERNNCRRHQRQTTNEDGAEKKERIKRN